VNDDGATVAGTTFSQNTAHSGGGAIYQAYNPALTRSSTNATLSVTGSQIRGINAGQYGGGIDNASPAPAVPRPRPAPGRRPVTDVKTLDQQKKPPPAAGDPEPLKAVT
jgi:Chlamydia polymorphic membrane protein (Chlamydia_PMP) repeat